MKHLTDNELLKQTKTLVQQERELLTQVLEHLREISDRKLFSELGYKSLFEFAVKHLGYSEDSAYRRIAAMKLVRQVPGLEEKIQSGEVHLTHISLAQSLFRQEAKLDNPLSSDQKVEVFNKIAGTSAREAEKITLQMSSKPEALRPEKIRAISEDSVSVQVTIKCETLKKMETLKGWLAHRFPHLSTGELIEKLCDLAMVEWNPSKPRGKKGSSQTSASREPTAQVNEKQLNAKENSDAVPNQNSNQSSTVSSQERNSIQPMMAPSLKRNLSQSAISNSEFHNLSQSPKLIPSSSADKKRIPTSLRKQIFRIAQNQCEKCHSSFFLEIDHKFPQALGGTNDPENLRLLCRNCNQRSAINAFGKEKIMAHAKGHPIERQIL